jgi:hypothetical protein
VREELYAQCFDELIREVTVNCAERGLLLLRVRDEMRMTIAAYQTLYESAVAFGIRKALQTEQGKAELETRIQQLEVENKDLERQVCLIPCWLHASITCFHACAVISWLRMCVRGTRRDILAEHVCAGHAPRLPGCACVCEACTAIAWLRMCVRGMSRDCLAAHSASYRL